MLNFRVAGFARIQFDSEKTELWRVRLHVSILIFIFDRPLVLWDNKNDHKDFGLVGRVSPMFQATLAIQRPGN